MSTLDKFKVSSEDKSIPKYKKATIYFALIRLHHKIRTACFCMTKVDRREYGEPLKKAVADCIKDFVVAYDFEAERPRYYMKLVADLHYLTVIVDEIDAYKVLRVPAKDVMDIVSGTRTEGWTNKPEKVILQIYEEIGKIDEGISKWRSTAMRSCSSSNSD